MQKDSATPGVAHLRLLSDALEELCSARTEEGVVRICGAVARQACNVGGVAVVLATGEQFQFAQGDGPNTLSHAIRSKVIVRMSALALESAQTAVVPDVHRDERTRSHTNGTTFARSLVVVPVGRPTPFAAATFAWAQEHWPSASEVLVLEALARATGLALRQRLAQSESYESDEPGSVHAWLESAADTEGLRGPERRHWLALAELQHRVRNVLSLVRSLVHRACETSASTENYAEQLEGRIGALARIQGMVVRRPGDGVDLERLIDSEMQAHTALDRRVQTAGPHIRLRAKAAETVGLALHELAINTLKHGLLGAPEGRVTITWRMEVDRESRCLRLEWIEAGLPSGTPPSPHRGFGRDLIERTVPYELRGTTRFLFEPGGVHCIIDIPFTPDLIVLGPTPIVE